MGHRSRTRSWRFRAPRVLLLVLGLAVALALGLAATGSAADKPYPTEDFGDLTIDISNADIRPGQVEVIVQVSGDPVAVVQAEADRELTEQEETQIANELEAKQNAIEPRIQQLGGQVVDDFQYAYNGIRVKIERGRLGDVENLENVVAVHRIGKVYLDHQNSVPLIRAPEVWGGIAGVGGFKGEGIKVAIMDTGIDYTHADFGGPGTVEAYEEEHADEANVQFPQYFGPDAPKVKGGYDFVGDEFTGSNEPQPDPDPIDCNGHGSHVAGTAAGFGVTDEGETFQGPYDTTTFTRSFTVGPGVAPLADLYALKVFGCAGSTTEAIMIAAMEWTVENDMDVLNMSIGSPYGSRTEATAAAATNTARSGVIVVASAGNNMQNPYITGSPASGTWAIGVAANESAPTFPGVRLELSDGSEVVANLLNDVPVEDGTNVEVFVAPEIEGEGEPDGIEDNVGLGCHHPSAPPGFNHANSYEGAEGKLVVTERGICARVARAIFGQKEGAVAVAMVNNGPGYPPFEGRIRVNPDTGEEYLVTIPFLGIRGVLGPPPTDDGDRLAASASVTMYNTGIPNPNFLGFATFTSGGPRFGDSWLKPDVTAPGVSILSAGVGLGTEGAVISGTSMAAPHTAGLAALVKQSHPGWRRVEDLKAAIVNTASPAGVAGLTGYRISRGGTGLIQAPPAVVTQTVAIGDRGTGSLSFGYEELLADFSESKTITLRNNGRTAATFEVSLTNPQGRPHTASVSATTVTVPARGTATVPVALSVPVATVGNSEPGADPFAFREVGGLVTFTPTAGSNGGVTLRVPYYLVPRALSNVQARVEENELRPTRPRTTATVTNNGVIPGIADFYVWGLDDPNERDVTWNDLRAVGVQSFPFAGGDRFVVFAINQWHRVSNAGANYYELPIDNNDDGNADWFVIAADPGLFTGTYTGRLAVFTLRAGTATLTQRSLAIAPSDTSTVLLPLLASHIGVTAASPRFSYGALSEDPFHGESADDVIADERGRFNAFSPSISQGMYEEVNPGESTTVPVEIDPAEWALTPAKGIMVVTFDDRAGAPEADLIRIRLLRR